MNESLTHRNAFGNSLQWCHQIRWVAVSGEWGGRGARRAPPSLFPLCSEAFPKIMSARKVVGSVSRPDVPSRTDLIRPLSGVDRFRGHFIVGGGAPTEEVHDAQGQTTVSTRVPGRSCAPRPGSAWYGHLSAMRGRSQKVKRISNRACGIGANSGGLL
jgi:hypothetical protein